jgi:tripartite-type tricarboxylate transporter receptor subunit TctC
MLKHMAGLDMTHVPFRGSGPAIQELLAGRISLLIDSLSLYSEHIKAGTLRALAVSTPSRSFLMPELPTIGETLPGFDASAFNYFAAPASTPAAVVARLNRETNAILAEDGFKRRMAAIGLEGIGGTPEDCAQVISTERERWRTVIRAANIRPE